MPKKDLSDKAIVKGLLGFTYGAAWQLLSADKYGRDDFSHENNQGFIIASRALTVPGFPKTIRWRPGPLKATNTLAAAIHIAQSGVRLSLNGSARKAAVDNLVYVIDRVAKRGGLKDKEVAEEVLYSLVAVSDGISPKVGMARTLIDAWNKYSPIISKKFGDRFVASSISVGRETDFTIIRPLISENVRKLNQEIYGKEAAL